MNMDILVQSPSFLLGLIGWAATAKLVLDKVQMDPLQQRMLIVFTWILWMVPAFDVIVYKGLMAPDSAVLHGSAATVLPAMMIALGFKPSS
jgi:hypothetical protein